MNMLNCNPKILCKYHLQEEHSNIHKQFSKIIKEEPVELGTYVALTLRHQELVLEQKRRGYEHRTPFPNKSIKITSSINSNLFSSRRRNLYDLLCNCEICLHNYKELNLIKLTQSIHEEKRRIYLVESALEWTRHVRDKVYNIVGPAMGVDIVATLPHHIRGLRDYRIIDFGRPPFANPCYIDENLLMSIDPTFKHLYGGSYI